MKKTIFLLLAVVFTLSLAGFVYAGSVPASPPERPSVSYVEGTIVKATDTAIEIKPSDGGRNVSLSLEDRRPLMVDCVSGEPMVLGDRKDDTAAAYYSSSGNNAMVIILNIPANTKPPHFCRAEAVDKAGNQVKVTIDDGSLIVTISNTIDIFSYVDRGPTTFDTINVGSDLLIWYPGAGTGSPAQATATKVLHLGSEKDMPPKPSTVIELSIGNSQAMVNGSKVTLDAPPLISNNRTMLPARFVAENLECTVDWNAATQTVTITSGSTKMVIQIGSTQATVDGARVTLDAPPILSNNRTMLPIRFITENLKCNVDWNETARTVIIMK